MYFCFFLTGDGVVPKLFGCALTCHATVLRLFRMRCHVLHQVIDTLYCPSFIADGPNRLMSDHNLFCLVVALYIVMIGLIYF